jgi:2-phosphoglycerate kinase
MAPRNLAVHILYGIPCAGKSTSAVQLAYRRNIRTVIHTDYVREVQKCLAPSEQAPALAKVTHNAWELYGAATRQNVVMGFLTHVEAVAVGVRIVVRKLVRDGFDAVIEGAHFHSGIIENLRITNREADVQATLLVVGTAEELRKRVCRKENARAQGAEPKRWQDNITAMLTIQDYLISDARDHGIHVATGDELERRLWTQIG